MKINSTVFLAVFLFFCLKGYSQNNHEVRIFYGFADNALMRAPLGGDAGYDNENCYELGVKYLRELKTTALLRNWCDS